MRGRMERMQKATIVGQLSNLIAHELAQPLAAVQYYLDGMKTLLSRQPVNTAMLEKSRVGIEQGLERTKAIVAKVRGYSRNQTRRDRTVSLKTTIDNVLTAISPDLQRTVAFKCESVEGIEVLGDALELELLMRNLIKNAFEAAASAARSDGQNGSFSAHHHREHWPADDECRLQRAHHASHHDQSRRAWTWCSHCNCHRRGLWRTAHLL